MVIRVIVLYLVTAGCHGYSKQSVVINGLEESTVLSLRPVTGNRSLNCIVTAQPWGSPNKWALSAFCSTWHLIRIMKRSAPSFLLRVFKATFLRQVHREMNRAKHFLRLIY